MFPLDQTALASLLLGLTAVSSVAMGGVVLYRNSGKLSHRIFALLTLNLSLWALGVLVIIHCHTPDAARLWIKVTFMIAGFLPATFYHFCGCFPSHRFLGSRAVLAGLYSGAALVAIAAHTPWYLYELSVFPDEPPLVVYGPAFMSFGVFVAASMVASFGNLVTKLRVAAGVQRRQLEHVFLGVFASTVLATATNVLAPVMNIGSLELYGPCFMVFLMGVLAYSMIRYQLLDIWVIVSRSTVYAILTAAVVAIFLGSVAIVHYLVSATGHARDLLTTALAALLIALVIQPLRERVQLVLDRAMLKRRYDARLLMERISREAAQFMHLNSLLARVCEDIRNTLGVSQVRVVLAGEKQRDTLITEYSTRPEEIGRESIDYDFLLAYVAEHPEPIVLEELLHSRPTPARIRIAEQVADLDTFLCVPLKTASGVAGLLLLGEKTSRDIYTNEDITLFSTLAGPLGAAIENARLYRKIEEVNLHLERIMANMRGGVVAVGVNGVITTVNQGARDILGDVRAGQRMETLRPPLGDLLRRALAEQRPISDFETVIVGPDGENIPVLISASLLARNERESLGAMALVFNLTMIKRLEANVQRADRLSSLGTVAAGMAHEIKNPLVSIKTFTQLLPTRYQDLEFRTTFSEIVLQEVDRINAIVTRLLDFARPKPVRFAPQNVCRILQDTLTLVESQTRKLGIKVSANLIEGDREISGDDQQLHQVFLNLLLNAIDALQDSRERQITVTMRYDRAHLRRKDAPPLLDAECVKISIADTGCGIPQDALDQVFTPFFTTKANGSGLGLSVVQGIVSSHNGVIDVSSIPGMGTLFTLTFPLLTAGQPAQRHTL